MSMQTYPFTCFEKRFLSSMSICHLSIMSSSHSKSSCFCLTEKNNIDISNSLSAEVSLNNDWIALISCSVNHLIEIKAIQCTADCFKNSKTDAYFSVKTEHSHCLILPSSMEVRFCHILECKDPNHEGKFRLI